MSKESPFQWQLDKQPQLTENTLSGLSNKKDFFGREFVVGDQVLHVTLMEKTSCCGFSMVYTQLHKDSIPLLEEQYEYSHMKAGIPRYGNKNL